MSKVVTISLSRSPARSMLRPRSKYLKHRCRPPCQRPCRRAPKSGINGSQEFLSGDVRVSRYVTYRYDIIALCLFLG